MVEDDEHDANRLLRVGLEQALGLKERLPSMASNPSRSTPTHTSSDALHAEAWEAHKVAAAEVKAAADTTWALEKRRLYRVNRDTLKAVEEW
jgi:hypothetical protein